MRAIIFINTFFLVACAVQVSKSNKIPKLVKNKTVSNPVKNATARRFSIPLEVNLSDHDKHANLIDTSITYNPKNNKKTIFSYLPEFLFSTSYEEPSKFDLEVE